MPPGSLIVSITIFILICLNIFPHFILVQPYRISISPDEFVNIHSVYRRWPFDFYLFSIHENPHIFFLPFCFCLFSSPLLSSRKLLFYLRHLSYFIVLKVIRGGIAIGASRKIIFEAPPATVRGVSSPALASQPLRSCPGRRCCPDDRRQWISPQSLQPAWLPTSP